MRLDTLILCWLATIGVVSIISGSMSVPALLGTTLGCAVGTGVMYFILPIKKNE